MICSKCNNDNREGSEFCRFCGANITHDNFPKPNSKEVHLKLKFSRRALIIVGVLLLLGASAAYAAPKVKSYFDVNKSIAIAKDSQAKGDYKNALDTLNTVEGKWMLGSTREELENLKKQENNFIQDKGNYDSAISKENSGDLEGARSLLQSIPGDFPEYTNVQTEIASLQSKIEDQLKAKAQEATAAKAAAEQKASAARAAAVQAAQAQADAEAAAAQAAANAAANQAAAQAAQQEAARQQAAAQAAAAQAAAAQQAAAQAQAIAQQQAQVANSNYINALVNAMNLENTANNEINYAVNAFINGNYSLAISYLNQSESDSYNAEHELPYTYPAIFQTVNNDFINAANYCNLAAHELYTSMVNLTSGDQAFADQSTGISYYNKIKTDLSLIGF